MVVVHLQGSTWRRKHRRLDGSDCECWFLSELIQQHQSLCQYCPGLVLYRHVLTCVLNAQIQESLLLNRTAMNLGVLIIQGRHWLLCCWLHLAPIGTSTIYSKYQIKYLTNSIIYECFVDHLGPNPVKKSLDIAPLCESDRCLIGIGNFSRSNMEEANLDEVILLMVQKSGKPTSWGKGSLSHYLQGFSTIPGGFLAGFLKHQTVVGHWEFKGSNLFAIAWGDSWPTVKVLPNINLVVSIMFLNFYPLFGEDSHFD